MLIGTYEHNVDAKGRMFLPAKWRDDLGNTVIVTRGMMGKSERKCLFGMSQPAWNDLLSRFQKLPMADVTAQNLMRRLFANACECEVDKQGRILVSAALREYAGLDEGAIMIGLGGRIEIWGAKSWQAFNENEEEDAEALAALSGFGI